MPTGRKPVRPSGPRSGGGHFRDRDSALCDLGCTMANREAKATCLEATTEADLDEDLRQAAQDFARGDFIELTVAELDRCIATGEWPWPDASSG